MNRYAIVALLAAVGLLTTGCGGGDSVVQRPPPIMVSLPQMPTTTSLSLVPSIPTSWTTNTGFYVWKSPNSVPPVVPSTWNGMEPLPYPFWGLGRTDTSTNTLRTPWPRHHRHHRRRPPYTWASVPGGVTTSAGLTYGGWPYHPQPLVPAPQPVTGVGLTALTTTY